MSIHAECGLDHPPGTKCPDGRKILDLIGCARCHGDGHERLVFKELTHPVTFPGVDGVVATHWALCPTTNEPILWGKVDEPVAS